MYLRDFILSFLFDFNGFCSIVGSRSSILFVCLQRCKLRNMMSLKFMKKVKSVIVLFDRVCEVMYKIQFTNGLYVCVDYIQVGVCELYYTQFQNNLYISGCLYNIGLLLFRGVLSIFAMVFDSGTQETLSER
eukprot:TRINITY_DN7646_c1_g1_i14.p2 TRINITY_DN7646_c1_g1~~TRINITY_DN7646_c1_g1_i14.p2  ORF type:complete len:132 (-),score=5.33 TRINITY_DN7646_c1_g1_i14:136-531(-)